MLLRFHSRIDRHLCCGYGDRSIGALVSAGGGFKRVGECNIAVATVVVRAFPGGDLAAFPKSWAMRRQKCVT